jgi:hypothetical protein
MEAPLPPESGPAPHRPELATAREQWDSDDERIAHDALQLSWARALELSADPDELERILAWDRDTITTVLEREERDAAGISAPAAPPPVPDPPPGLHTVSLAEFLAEPPRVAAPFVVEDLLPVTAGVIVLAGPQKTSKTIMALQVAISVAGGNAGVLGRKVGRHGPVLFIEEEGNRDKLRERIAAMLTGLEQERPPEDLHLALFERVQVDDDTSMALIATAVDRIKPVAIMLDPLAYLHRQDENDNTAMNSRVMRPLVGLAASYDLLVVVLHHVTKNGGESPLVGKRVRGAGGITAASDGNIVFQRTGPTTIRAQGEYRDAGPLDTYYRFDEERMILVEEQPEIPHRISLEQVLELVNGQVSVSVTQAMAAWGVTRHTARDVLLDAAAAGAIDHAQDAKLGHLFMALGVAI